MSVILSEFITFLLSIINIIVQVVFAPIDILLTNLIPDISPFIGNIDTLLNSLTSYFTYIISYIPPLTKELLSVYIAFLIGYYSFSLSYKGITTIIKLIQKFKN